MVDGRRKDKKKKDERTADCRIMKNNNPFALSQSKGRTVFFQIG